MVPSCGGIDVGKGGESGDDDVSRLVDEYQQQGPHGEVSGLAEPRTTPVEPGTPAIAGSHQHRDEDDRLQGDAQRRADAEDGHLIRRENAISGCRRAGDDDEEDEGGDRHDVVEDGSEHRRTAATCVEHLAEQRVDSVEEDLRQAQPRECRCQFTLGVVVGGRRVEVDEDGCEQDRGNGEDEQDDPCQGDEPVCIGLAPVCVVLHAAHQLRDEHRVEGAADDEDV